MKEEEHDTLTSFLMATLSNNLLLTARDLEILTARDRCPLTAEQLLKLSRSFAAPFTSERRVRERLQQLAAAGRVRRWLYATAGRGALGYYTLSRLGHQLLRADEAALAPNGRSVRSASPASSTRCGWPISSCTRPRVPLQQA